MAKPSPASNTRGQARSPVAAPVVFGVLCIVGFGIYSNTFHSTFHFDDKFNIVENYLLRDLTRFWPPLGTRWAGYFSFALNYKINGLNVAGYHLVNTFIHVTNAFLVYLLTLSVFPVIKEAVEDKARYMAALTAAFIFISHPIETQAITYITQRFASLSTLFFLLSLLLYVKARTGGGVKLRFYIPAVLSAVLALKTKEISATLPIVIVLYEYAFFTGRESLKKRALYAAPFFIALLIIPLDLLGIGAESGIAEEMRVRQVKDLTLLSRQGYFLTEMKVIVTYMRLLVLPVNQSLDYLLHPVHGFPDIGTIASGIFILALIVTAIFFFIVSKRAQRPLGLIIAFGALWFFITLSVESSFIPIQDVMNEHRLYLPSVGAFMAVGALAAHVVKRFGLNLYKSLAVFFVIVIVPLSISSYLRNRVWKDDITLWGDVVKKSPINPRAHVSLGFAYAQAGTFDKAEEQYRLVLDRINPQSAEAQNGLGDLYYKTGRIAEATEAYSRSLANNPDDPYVHYNLAVLYVRNGRVSEASSELKEALRLRPDYPEAHNNLANIYMMTGDIDGAVVSYRSALRLKPDHVDAHYNLGAAYLKKGLANEALAEFEAVLRLNPNDSGAREMVMRLRGG
ncbi:MAG: tetratricopeptide repeat protein [Deltaproteobacteria bacterium]|nr:tetratricopeptide repeat protein [Deltaproteobacteria bacterium]